jgi:hypothetical protein
VLSPSGDGVLGQIRLSDTERIAAPRDNSEAALVSRLIAMKPTREQQAPTEPARQSS